MIIVVGSRALSMHGINLRTSESDFDLWAESLDDIPPFPEDVSPDAKVIPLDILKEIPTTSSYLFRYATPDAIYTIKCSHLGYSNPMWNKHKLDILALKNKGCKIIPKLYEKLFILFCIFFMKIN